MNEKELLSKLKKDPHKILIYGAGMVGNLVLSRLLSENIPAERIAFIVSHKGKEDAHCQGHYIYDISDASLSSCNKHIIVATLPNAHAEIIQTLHKYHYYEFTLVDNELFAEMEKAYIEKHNAENPIAQGNKDVLFMPSDNNASSGAFLCMVDINRGLNNHGISTLVILPSYGSGEELLRKHKIQFTYVLSKDWLIKDGSSIPKNLDENTHAVKEIRNLIKKYNIKLIHNNTTYTYVGAVAAQKEHKPVVWHLREFIKEQGFWFRDEGESFKLINESSAVIVVSDYIRKCYPNLDPCIVHRIYDGLDTSVYYNKEHTLMTGRKIKILMPGMMIPLKGQRQLLEAALLLWEQDDYDFEIAFVGSADPEYLLELKKFIKDNALSPYVSFYGRSGEMPAWYSWADITVVCSKSEAFGRVAVEAQLAGCLVITADTGALAEIIEDKKTGYLYQYGHISDLASKIRKAITNRSKTCEIVKAGQEKAVKLFSKERNVNEIMKLYTYVLNTQCCEDTNAL